MKSSVLFNPIELPECSDPLFYPISLGNLKFREQLKESASIMATIAIEGDQERVIRRDFYLFAESIFYEKENTLYVERLIKSMLWIYGGYKIYMDLPSNIAEHITQLYSFDGVRSFDVHFMERIYERPFQIIRCQESMIPHTRMISKHIGRNLEGYRIGFDAGGSDRKVSAMINGVPVFSEEVIWFPKLNADPAYHYQGIMDSLKRAMLHLPKIDAIGVSSAGVCINNRLMASSLFIKVPEEIFNRDVKNIYLDIAQVLGDIPIEVANDGEVTALAGSMSLNINKVLGIAMGTSQASGYVNQDGHITGWLNELAFVPVDYNLNQAIDPWSGDVGCGVNYFSQDAIIRLAALNQLYLDNQLSPAEKLIIVQKALMQNDERALRIYQTMGIYLGFGLAYYHEFFDFDHVMVLGRVMSGYGGDIIVKQAELILKAYFPEIDQHVTIHLPDESNRRVGQSIAAASLVNQTK